MNNRDVIGIGASAGGIQALLTLVGKLPPDLPAAVLVTIHLHPQFRSSLDDIVSRAGRLPAAFAREGDAYRPGAIYIAPPDRHLLVYGDRLRLGSGPRENNSRPAIDPMLRSAAACCGVRSIGVVLTGTLGDGASGLWAVDRCGGLTVVQDPDDAAFPEMPLNALRRVAPDFVLPMADIAAKLDELARRAAGDPVAVPGHIPFEVEIARGQSRDSQGQMEAMDQIGRRSVLACPECHGVLWEIDEGELTRYRCHTGHAYTAELLNLALDESLRRALAGAARALEEQLTLTKRLHRQAEEAQHSASAADWALRVTEVENELGTLRAAMQRVDELKSGLMRRESGD
jgi:two-component system chemotaxis response regulator CheB